MRTGLRLRRFQWVAQAVTVIVVLFDAALSATGVLTVRQALVLFAVVEIPLMCVVATAFTVTVVTRTRRGDGVRSAMVHALGHSPFLPLIRAEIRGYRALWQAIRGRDCGVEPDAIVLRARRGALALPVAFAIATVVEIGALHLLLPWAWLRVALALVSVWSLIALSVYLAVHRTHPHYLTGASLVLRQSGAVVAVIDRARIESVVARRRFTQTAPTVVDGRLFLPGADGTTVDLTLTSPVTVTLPALVPARRKTGEVDHISVYVDEPDLLVSALRGRRRRRNPLDSDEVSR